MAVLRLARAALRQILGLLLIAMVVLNVVTVAGRYLLGQTIAGSDELLVFSMVWLVFLGLTVVTADDGHLRFDVGGRRLSARLLAFRSAAIALLLAVLSAYMVMQSAEVLSLLGRINQRSMAADIPMVVPHSALLVGFALTALVAAGQAVVHTVRWVRGQGAAEGDAGR